MELETAGAGTPAADGVEPEATVENPEATAGQQSDAENTGEADAPDGNGEDSGKDAAAKPDKNWASDRIKELTRKRREAERRAERAEQRLREAQSTDLDGLDYEDQIAERTVRRTRQEQADTERETARELAMEAFAESESAARAKFSDYDAVTRNPSLAITESMLEVIADGERGPEVLYHLGKNPATALEIAAMPRVRQAKELGKLEERLSVVRAQEKLPPAPVKPVTGINAGGKKDPAKMTMPEYIKWREANP